MAIFVLNEEMARSETHKNASYQNLIQVLCASTDLVKCTNYVSQTLH